MIARFFCVVDSALKEEQESQGTRISEDFIFFAALFEENSASETKGGGRGDVIMHQLSALGTLINSQRSFAFPLFALSSSASSLLPPLFPCIPGFVSGSPLC